MVQWLRLHTLNAGALSSNPAQGTRSYMLQLRVHMPQLKISRAAMKMQEPQHCQINNVFFFLIMNLGNIDSLGLLRDAISGKLTFYSLDPEQALNVEALFCTSDLQMVRWIYKESKAHLAEPSHCVARTGCTCTSIWEGSVLPPALCNWYHKLPHPLR